MVVGPLLCLLSAAGFGAMAIFGKLAYDAGVELGDLLLVRFALAAAVLLAVAWAAGALRGLPRRPVLAALGMGAIGYATQAGLYFAALERMDASLLALVLYAYPALVLVAAVALGRERATRRRVAALVVATAGTVLVLAGAASGTLDPLGTAMGFGAALAYTAYILVGDRVVAGVPPVALAALVCTGATGTFAVAALVTGGPELGFGADGLGLARRDRARVDGRRDPRVLRGPRAGRAVLGVDPLDARARRHGRPRGGGVRRVARRRAARRRRARALGGGGDAVAGGCVAPAGSAGVPVARRTSTAGVEAAVRLGGPVSVCVPARPPAGTATARWWRQRIRLARRRRCKRGCAPRPGHGRDRDGGAGRWPTCVS